MHRARLLAPLALLLALLIPAATIAATPAPRAATDVPQLREFQLTVARSQWEIAPGQFVDAFTYNGTVPGPQLRVTEGDTVRVTVTNALDESTTVHWHGVELPLSMDGVPGLSQEPIAPGGSFVYEFVATRAGTRWYHSNFKELSQQGSGLFGALIVDPRPIEAEPPVDRDYVVFANEWVTAVAPADGHDEHGGHDGGGAGMGRPTYDAFPINGKVYPYTDPLMVREGERVRLRLINSGAIETQKLVLPGHQLAITHTDGNRLGTPLPAEALLLGAGERADVEFVADNPGRWQLRSLMPGHFEGGMAVDVVYEGHEADAPLGLPPGARPRAATYLEMAGPPHPEPADQTFDMTLSDQLASGDFWTINGERYPNTTPMNVQAGERVRLRLINLSAEDHPMHLHGHTFQVVAVGEQPIDGPLKDTLNLRYQESYDVEFEANADPGVWLFHCHNIVHMGGGMTVELRYR